MSGSNQWIENCPRCKGQKCLLVHEVILVATGETIHPYSYLHVDGFIVDPCGFLCDIQDQSTTHEKVRCVCCAAEFRLEDLIIKE